MPEKIKVALVGLGNCFSGLIQGIEYYSKNPSQKVTGIIHENLRDYTIHDIDLLLDLMLVQTRLENQSMRPFMNCQIW